MLGHVIGGADVYAWLYGQDHARAQNAAGALGNGFTAAGIHAGAGLVDFAGLGVAAAVVHVHAHPVAGAVHVKTKVGALRDDIVCTAVFVCIKQPQIEQPLRDDAHGGIVRIVKTCAWLDGSYGRFLRG